MDWATQDPNGNSVLVNPLTATSDATVVTASGTANTKGSWVEVTASLEGFGGIGVTGQFTPVDHLIDVAVGASGSEVVVAENLYFGNGTSMRLMPQYVLPLQIKNGERVSLRVQAGLASSAPNIFVYSTPAPKTLGRCTTYGANTADSGGVLVDPGATINTKGPWYPVTASTTRDIKALILALGNQGQIARTSCKWLIDVAIGASGSEVVIVENYGAGARTEDDTILPQVSPLIGVNIPAGTRIAVRCQCTLNTATVRLFDALIYGFD